MERRYHIDMVSLLSKRQSYFISDLPPKMQDMFNTADTLLAGLKATPNVVNKSQLKDLKSERENLFNEIKNATRDVHKRRDYMLDYLAAEDMEPSAYHTSDDRQFDRVIDDKEKKLIAFINKLEQIKSSAEPKN